MDVLNPWMLAGLSAVVLPVLVHLFSRRRFDVVAWGAMQFLELQPRQQRRMYLADLLLLLLRMLLLALVALALARPWSAGSWLSAWLSAAPRDLVVVIDSSGSMGWQNGPLTSHQRAIRACEQLIEQLSPDDTLTVLEARDLVRPLGPRVTTRHDEIVRLLATIPPPTGTCHFESAIGLALQAAAEGRHLQRDIVVLTDGQVLPWHLADTSRWIQLDDQFAQAPVPPRVFAIDLSGGQLSQATNYTLGALRPARESTVVGMPLRLQTVLRGRGPQVEGTRNVMLEVNGQRIPGQTRQVRLLPDVELPIEFEHTFEEPGSHVVSLVLDEDDLSSDNRCEAVIIVNEALPVILVDGSPQADPVRSETFFARHALSSDQANRSWVASRVVPLAECKPNDLEDQAVIVFANVARLETPLLEGLSLALERGQGVIVALGDQTDAAWWNAAEFTLLAAPEPDTEPQTGESNAPPASPAVAAEKPTHQPLLPIHIEPVEAGSIAPGITVRVDNESLKLPWLKPFRAEQGGTLTEARFDRWWKLVPGTSESGKTEVAPEMSTLILARLTQGDPWFISSVRGTGTLLVLASSLDADWNTLPARTDYVPWLHETIFAASQRSVGRNVQVGQPLVMRRKQGDPIRVAQFRRPDGEPQPADVRVENGQLTLMLPSADRPGIFRLSVTGAAGALVTDEPFAVEFDRREADLTTLTDDQKRILMEKRPLTFSNQFKEVQQSLRLPAGRVEFGSLLLYLFIGLLVVEVWMTSRMTRSGHPTASRHVAG